MPSLDIIVVTWNAGALLDECLRSVEEATKGTEFDLNQCIVVDNASTDGSAKGLPHHAFDAAVIRNSTNAGFAAACNRGAAEARGDYLLFLNPDTRLFPESLSKPIAFLEDTRNDRVGLLGIQLVDAGGRVQPTACRFPTPGSLLYQMIGLDRLWPSRFPPFSMSDWDHQQTQAVDCLQGAFLLVRRAAFEQIGGFDARFFMYYEDVDLAYRARQASWLSFYLADAQAYHLGGGSTDNIRATRLFYWMRSRAQYSAAHFGRPAAAVIVVASFSVELFSRVVWNTLHFSWRHLSETIEAYTEYARAFHGIWSAPSAELERH